MGNGKAVMVCQTAEIAKRGLTRSIDEATGRAPYTLPGLFIGGIIGALIDGPRGALIGGAIGGSLGFVADTMEKKRSRPYSLILPATAAQ